jgi:2-keto-4-pentenoate hydratase/2-oxohepta-3-ene-1,7-dioic acid hydratase in catechol pathway
VHVVRFVRFLHEGSPRYGVLEGAEVVVIEPHPFAQHRPTGERVPVEGLRLLAPVIPSKIVGVVNDPATGSDRPDGGLADQLELFLKPSSSVIGPGEPIRLPTDRAAEVHHGAQLAVVVGALLQRVGPERALAGVFGYTCANDVTARDLERAGRGSLRTKGFDSFCPLGPAVTTGLDPAALRVHCQVDDGSPEEASTADLLVDVATLVSEVSQVVTLLPSDVILTGTPVPTGPIVPGQRVRVEVEGIGVLENPVVDREAVTERTNGGA